MFKPLSLLMAASVLFATAVPAMAGAGDVPRDVRVTDVRGKPVAGASVLEKTANGPVLLATTAADGSARVSVPDRAPIFARLGDQTSAVKEASGAQLFFSIAPKVIATSVSHPRGPERNVGAESALALLSGGVQGALNYLPNYRSGAEGGSTESRLDGTPLTLPSLPGSNPFQMPSNLISSFTPDQADDGSIVPNYHLQSPTSTPQQSFEYKAGAPGLDVWRGTVTGPHYAFVVADQTQAGWLAQGTQPDGSGLTYNHALNQHELDASMNLAFDIGSVNVSAVGFATRIRQSQVSLVEPGELFEGIGPNNWQSSDLVNGYIRALSSHGNSSWMFIHADFAGTHSNDDANAVIAGVPYPSDNGFDYSGRYDQLSFSQDIGSNVLTEKVSNTLTNAASFEWPFESSTKSSTTTYDLNFAHNGKNLTRTLDVSEIQDTGAFPVEHLNAALRETRWTQGSRFSWSLYSAQSDVMQTYYANALRLAPPGAADYSCGTGDAYAQGPSRVAPEAPHIVAATASGSETIDRNTQITAGGFYSETTNALVLESEAGTVPLSGAYLDVLNAGYAGVCGQSEPLTSQNVFLTHYVTVPRVIGKEAYVSLDRSFGRLHMTANYETYGDTAMGVPAQRGAISTLVNNAQIWNVPVHRESLILQHSTSGVLEAVGAAYVSGNNSAHLPPNLVVSTGVSVPASSGRLNLSVQNLFGSYAGYIVSTRFSALSATTQVPVAFPSNPVQRTWYLTYQFSLHNGVTTP